MAIMLHYMFLCVFSWMFIEAIHLYRMLTEMRDINHGQMRFYYSIGYGKNFYFLIISVVYKLEIINLNNLNSECVIKNLGNSFY